jgi:hypothetical protein
MALCALALAAPLREADAQGTAAAQSPPPPPAPLLSTPAASTPPPPPAAPLATPPASPPKLDDKKPETDPFGPRNAISVRPLAFFGYGVSVQYERYILPRWLSAAGGLGYRYGGGGDYSGSTGTLSLHSRLWMVGRSLFTKLADRAMVGPYLELGLRASYTTLTDDVADRWLGSTFTLTELLLFGCRFNIGPFELSPALGTGLSTEFGHHLAAETRVVLAFDGTVGWMF